MKLRTDFRTHNKFSKRIYYSFYLLWWTLHCMDWVIQRTIMPEFSLGFDTLTAYPDPDPETTTVDGQIWRAPSSMESWSTIRNGAGHYHADSNAIAAAVEISSDGEGGYDKLTRSIYLFDTSLLTSTSIVSACSFFIMASGQNINMDLVSSNPASNSDLVIADFSQLGTTLFCDTSYYGGITYTSTEFVFNATGLSNISKISVTKLGLRWVNDRTGSESSYFNSTSAYAGINVKFADSTGTDDDPKLVVTYTLPSINQRSLV